MAHTLKQYQDVSTDTSNSQLSISFDICARNHKGNVYSIAAHKKVVSYKLSIAEKILALLSLNPAGLTAEEIRENLSRQEGKTLSQATISARCSDLRKEGKVRECGEPRPTATGCKAAVLVMA